MTTPGSGVPLPPPGEGAGPLGSGPALAPQRS
jgi:hypothetical protein